ncbi:hypothetical protein VNO77_22650 [Canavalia gladiata]|uniref:Uncharacterized protein n=1 Tax=Canavalia gladiata TaxID=3824 RepID=A0AAN9L2Z5_CANGL
MWARGSSNDLEARRLVRRLVHLKKENSVLGARTRVLGKYGFDPYNSLTAAAPYSCADTFEDCWKLAQPQGRSVGRAYNLLPYSQASPYGNFSNENPCDLRASCM